MQSGFPANADNLGDGDERDPGLVCVERVAKLKLWSAMAMRSDTTASSYNAGLCLVAVLHWTYISFGDTA